jgi:CRP/FNR family transcriptional regulator, cyclic AMP receptor protein
MTLLEGLGFVALVLTVASFIPRTVTTVRVIGIAAGIAAALYGSFAPNIPMLVAGLLVAIINLWRLAEMRRLVSAVRSMAGGPLTLDWLLPYMRPIEIPAGHVLFSKGDKADAMYFVSSGRVRLEELAAEMTRGSMFGEMGIFSAERRRSVTARCVEPSSLLMISAEKVRELYYQNPRFGFYLVGIVAERLAENGRDPKKSQASSLT